MSDDAPKINLPEVIKLMNEWFPPRPLAEMYADWLEYMSKPVYRPPDVQLKFPRSKKKRIQKKWRNNPKNWGQVIYTLSKNPEAVIRRMQLKRERQKQKRLLAECPTDGLVM